MNISRVYDYEFTFDELVDVAVVRATQCNWAVVLCVRCGKPKLMLTRDTGMSLAWLPAANVIDRLRSGHPIEAKIDR